MPTPPSDEQLDAIRYAHNKVIIARPGSGKTFTLSQMIVKESAELLSHQGIIAISHTRKASAELRNRCIRHGAIRNKSFYGTIDSFCLNEIVYPFLSRYPGVARRLFIIDSVEEYDEAPKCRKKQLVVQALKSGKLPINMSCGAALQILDTASAAEDYIKARYASVYVDEYQDCGEPQHELIMKLSSIGLKTVVVGDLDQAIYRWCNKSPDHLSALLKSPNFKNFELTKNYRCHPSIINYSLCLLGYSYHPVPVEEFRVIRAQVLYADSETLRARGPVSYTDETSAINAFNKYLDGIKEKYAIENNSDIAVLARWKSTLRRCGEEADALELPFKMHEDSPLDTRFSVWGSLFSNLLDAYYSFNKYAPDFVDKYISPYSDAKLRVKAIDLISEYFSLSPTSLSKETGLAVKIAKLCEPDARDNADVSTYQSLVSNESMLKYYYNPAAVNEINLMTYHKAKGLEFDAVVCLDMYDSVFPGPNRSEHYDVYKESLSLHYVGITRARKVCYIPTATHRYKWNSRNRSYYPTPAKPSPFFKLRGVERLRREVEW